MFGFRHSAIWLCLCIWTKQAVSGRKMGKTEILLPNTQQIVVSTPTWMDEENQLASGFETDTISQFRFSRCCCMGKPSQCSEAHYSPINTLQDMETLCVQSALSFWKAQTPRYTGFSAHGLSMAGVKHTKQTISAVTLNSWLSIRTLRWEYNNLTLSLLRHSELLV